MSMQSHPISTFTSANTTLSGWRLFISRLAWLVFSGVVVILLFLTMREGRRPILFDPLVQDGYQLVAHLIPYSQYLGYIVFLRSLVVGTYVLTAAVIFLRKSHDWLALLTSVTLILLPYLTFYSGDLYDLDYPYPSPWKELLPFFEGMTVTIGILCLLRLLFVFPDGQFEPRQFKNLVNGFLYLMIIAAVLSLFHGPCFYPGSQFPSYLDPSGCFL